jgi:hypothetical protein
LPDPSLAVIIPFFDETAFLRMAVQSVFAQGLRDAEVVVVNDNPERFGPDDIAALDLPGPVRIVHHDRNRGLSCARNTGIDATSAPWIGFLDADDYYVTDGLAAQLSLAQDTGADIVHANAYLSQVGSPSLRPLPRDAALFGQPRRGAGLAGVEHAQFITSSWSSLYRRDFLDGNALRFDPEQVRFEDRLFVLQTVTAARKIACLGQPVRVWRRRAGSISSTPPDLATHRLQVQLLEKCMAVMRAHAAQPGVPPRFLKRELFNTLSRLIWDIDVVLRAAATPNDPGLAALVERITRLLGQESFGTGIFEDPVLRHVSRVGLRSRHGVVSRRDFLELHRLLRTGEAAAFAALLAQRRDAAPAAAPARSAPAIRRRKPPALVLHLGMHKTGSTYLQRAALERRSEMLAEGVLFPRAGLAAPGFRAVRQDGFPGHLGLLAAVRNDDEDAPWQQLQREIDTSGADTVLLSCENMLMPVSADREVIRARLFRRLSGFGAVRLVAFVRRPDQGPEMLYRELACNGQRIGARTVEEFLVDYGATLTDLPGLFGPWEGFAGSPVTLAAHEAGQGAGHWRAFMNAAGLGRRLLHVPPPTIAPTYPSPDRDQVAAARLVNVLMPREADRIRVLRTFFSATPGAEPRPDARLSLLPPAARLALVDRFAAQSAGWAAARGYAPDLDRIRADIVARPWEPQQNLPTPLLESLQAARLQAESALMPESAPSASRFLALAPVDQPEAPVGRAGEIVLRLRPRPWLRNTLRWLRRVRSR